MNKRPTQAREVLDYMRVHGSITTLEAIQELGCLRLASRISELRDAGYLINATTKKVKARSGRVTYIKAYSLEDLPFMEAVGYER